MSEVEATHSICGICLQEICHNDEIALECAHSFHPMCILIWFRQGNSQGRCPICRSFPDNTNSFENDSSENFNDVTTTEELSLLLVNEQRVQISQRKAHRLLCPIIYSSKRGDPSIRPMVDRYMSCRRKLIAATKTQHCDRRKKRRLFRAYSEIFQILASHLLFKDVVSFDISF